MHPLDFLRSEMAQDLLHHARQVELLLPAPILPRLFVDHSMWPSLSYLLSMLSNLISNLEIW